MRRKNLLKELGIQKQADTSCNALDIDTENIRQRVYAKLDFADTERKQTTMRSKKKILPLLIAELILICVRYMLEKILIREHIKEIMKAIIMRQSMRLEE